MRKAHGWPAGAGLIAAGLTVAATGHPHAAPDSALINAAKAAAAYDLRDPDSAQFRNLHIADGPLSKKVCGEINGKNQFGGYAGYRRFVYSSGTAKIEDTEAVFNNFAIDWDGC